jgi:hypothetical protein
MATKTLLLLATLCVLFASSCECEEDEFGEVLRMEIPVNVGANRNSFQVGDTLWINADFPKEVDVVDHQNDIELIGYNFFSTLSISEISGTDLRPYWTNDLIVETGEVIIDEFGDYNFTFVESDDRYSVRFGVVLSILGKFSATSFTNAVEQRGYEHPSLYTCKDNRRMNVFIDRINQFSNQENFEDFNNWRGGDGSFIQTFEGYSRSAMFAFQVIE